MPNSAVECVGLNKNRITALFSTAGHISDMDQENLDLSPCVKDLASTLYKQNRKNYSFE